MLSLAFGEHNLDLVLFRDYIRSKENETSEPRKWNSAGRALTKETVSYSTSARCVYVRACQPYICLCVCLIYSMCIYHFNV